MTSQGARTPVSSTERDPGAYFLGLLRTVVKFTPLFIYFFLYWNFKARIRRVLHIGALSFLSISLVILALEVLLELVGRDLLADLFHGFPNQRPLLLAGFVLSTLVVLAHHQRESRHTRQEYLLAEKLWSFLENRDSKDEAAFVAFALRTVKDSFDRHKALHACVWQKQGNEFRIQDCWTPPEPGDAGYITTLPLGEGIVGLVAADQLARYVPRLHFPFNGRAMRRYAWRFPHALKFEVVRSSAGYVDIAKPKVNVNGVMLGGTPPSFLSFIAVPIRATGGVCLGVLCIDFARTDPLGLQDIKMASVFGVIVGEELQRIRLAQMPP